MPGGRSGKWLNETGLVEAFAFDGTHQAQTLAFPQTSSEWVASGLFLLWERSRFWRGDVLSLFWRFASFFSSPFSLLRG